MHVLLISPLRLPQHPTMYVYQRSSLLVICERNTAVIVGFPKKRSALRNVFLCDAILMLYQ